MVHSLPDDEQLARAFVPPASPSLMPWLSRLEHLQHLCLQLSNIGEDDGTAAGQLLVQHISCMQHKAFALEGVIHIVGRVVKRSNGAGLHLPMLHTP